MHAASTSPRRRNRVAQVPKPHAGHAVAIQGRAQHQSVLHVGERSSRTGGTAERLDARRAGAVALAGRPALLIRPLGFAFESASRGRLCDDGGLETVSGRYKLADGDNRAAHLHGLVSNMQSHIIIHVCKLSPADRARRLIGQRRRELITRACQARSPWRPRSAWRSPSNPEPPHTFFF